MLLLSLLFLKYYNSILHHFNFLIIMLSYTSLCIIVTSRVTFLVYVTVCLLFQASWSSMASAGAQDFCAWLKKLLHTCTLFNFRVELKVLIDILCCMNLVQNAHWLFHTFVVNGIDLIVFFFFFSQYVMGICA